jgi:hypothetical protein
MPSRTENRTESRTKVGRFFVYFPVNRGGRLAEVGRVLFSKVGQK